MEGWKLIQGNYVNGSISEDEIWKMFNIIFSSKSKIRTSYKFGFIKALLENAFNVGEDGFLSLDNIFSTFTNVYWALIVKYNLAQGDKGVKGGETYVEKIINEYVKRYSFIRCCDYGSIKNEIKIELERDVLKECKKYVVGAIYGDSGGTLYSFSLKSNYISLNPSVFKFIKKFNAILLRLNHYEWIKFLEKVNPEENCHSIGIKLDEATRRTNLTKYKDFLFEELNSKNCFYCGRNIRYANIHVDHFVPWSYIRNDKLWNFVISCPKCNLSKSNKLPINLFLDQLIHRDNFIMNLHYDLVKKDFEIYREEFIKEIYNSAIFNGYDNNWMPDSQIRMKEIDLHKNIVY